jgi:uncharacterized protein YndB with AHSA1/START domain
MKVATDSRAKLTLPTDEQILIEREFDAPKHLVYEAYTTPELVKRWWHANRGDVTLVDIDLRVGGRWRYVMVTPDGTEVAFHGEYREIIPNERIVSTEVYEGLDPKHHDLHRCSRGHHANDPDPGQEQAIARRDHCLRNGRRPTGCPPAPRAGQRLPPLSGARRRDKSPCARPLRGSSSRNRPQGGFAVCHQSWFHRRDEEREASRRMWEEFDRTRPLSDPKLPEEEQDIVLEQPETLRFATKE